MSLSFGEASLLLSIPVVGMPPFSYPIRHILVSLPFPQGEFPCNVPSTPFQGLMSNSRVSLTTEGYGNPTRYAIKVEGG